MLICLRDLDKVRAFSLSRTTSRDTTKSLPLFEHYPRLKEKLAHVTLGQLPTPVQRLRRLGAELKIDHLYIKRDDLSGELYGGSKPRKLEFILGDAIRSGAKEVMTFGGAGSNHSLATALYARQLGLKSISLLVPQPNARYVRENLLMSHHFGAELCSCGTESGLMINRPLVYLSAMCHILRCRLKNGRRPYLVPPGGSSLPGIAGFVNAGLELKRQISEGEIPEPEYIYVACGTMGTTAGLLIGLKAAKLTTRVVSVRVTSEKFVNTKAMLSLISKVNSLLHSLDRSFPCFQFSAADIDIRHDCFGRRYALYTEEAMEAVALMREREDIKLDGTYTGKALVALIKDAENRVLRGKSVLFWNTLNSRPHPESAAEVDYRELPRQFHRYFREELQPLDRGPEHRPSSGDG